MHLVVPSFPFSWPTSELLAYLNLAYSFVHLPLRNIHHVPGTMLDDKDRLINYNSCPHITHWPVRETDRKWATLMQNDWGQKSNQRYSYRNTKGLGDIQRFSCSGKDSQVIDIYKMSRWLLDKRKKKERRGKYDISRRENRRYKTRKLEIL